MFHKVTGGFRSEWAALLSAATVSVVGVVGAAQISGKTALHAIADVLNPVRNAAAPRAKRQGGE